MKVMQAAQHVGTNIEHNLHTIAALKPRVVGLTEMAAGPNDDSSLSLARRILGDAGYTICTGEDGGDHCHEVPVAFREGRIYKIDSTTVTQLSPTVEQGLGNDRHLTVVKFHNRFTRRKGAHAHTHWNAGLQGPHGNVLSDVRVQAATEGSIIMEGALKSLLNRGYNLTVTGDFNWRLHDNDPAFHGWSHSPEAIFKRLGLTYTTSGLDWMAWSDGWHLLGSPRIIAPGTFGNAADHPWIVSRLSAVKV